ncbi:hypothetical protein INT45_004029 [Circinella minor]|uniref:DDE Tnp4 domain-containing protein n=1 Tax=Circinella minor TaxID=1195481 RepID=A0A8H7R8S9_9FUNG|nr:hypothetical protein INT45_004029 [Circinella minor]
MPRYSKKRQIEYTLGIISGLEAISNTTPMLIDGDDGDYGISCDPENDLEDNNNDRTLRYNPLSLVPWGELLDKISSQRYLDRSQKLPRAPSRIDWLFNELDDERFTQEVRMSKDAFNMILDKIKDDPIFVSSGPKPQKPVFLQLLVTTRRLGFYGNGASIGNIARYYGVGGDSGFECLKNIIVPYKKPRNSELTDQQDTFNMRLSSSLRELPIRLQDKDSAKHAVDWIKACMILHNMITAYRLDDIYNEEELTTILQEQQQQNSMRYDRRFNRATDLEEDLTPGKARRKEIFNQVMNSE